MTRASTCAASRKSGLNALQTQRQLFYDGWLLRVSPGKAKRARSVNAHFGSSLPLADKIALLRARCTRARACRRCFASRRSCSPPNLDDGARARAATWRSTRRWCRWRRSTRPPDIDARCDGVDVGAPPIDAFVDAVGELRRLVAASSAPRISSGWCNTPLDDARDRSRASTAVRSASGRSMLEDGLAGVFAWSPPTTCAGRGRDARCVAALLTWAWEHGASHAYLQVTATTRRRSRVYRKFGFATAYTYHYRGAAGGECRMNDRRDACDALAARARRRCSSRARLARARRPSRAPAGSSPARSPTSPGSSGWFDRGFVTYSNEAKIELLGVPPSDARGARRGVGSRRRGRWRRARWRAAGAHLAVAVTGIAGPGRRHAGQAGRHRLLRLGERDGAASATHHFAGDRAAVRAASVAVALEGLIERAGATSSTRVLAAEGLARISGSEPRVGSSASDLGHSERLASNDRSMP